MEQRDSQSDAIFYDEGTGGRRSLAEELSEQSVSCATFFELPVINKCQLYYKTKGSRRVISFYCRRGTEVPRIDEFDEREPCERNFMSTIPLGTKDVPFNGKSI